MANRCNIEISMPLVDIPYITEREQYQSVYNAQRRWRATHANEYIFGDKYERFMKAELDVYSEPLAYTAFGDKNGELWVKTERLKYFLTKSQFSWVSMDWGFKHDFPWWAQVGFANGEKTFGHLVPNQPESGGWLNWELDVSVVLTNLKYAIDVYEKFPISNQAWEWQEIYHGLDNLARIYTWFCKVILISPNAVATMDWSEVANNALSYEYIKSSNSPNEIMAEVITMSKHVKELKSGKLTRRRFEKIYAKRVGCYIPIAERDPYNLEGISI